MTIRVSLIAGPVIVLALGVALALTGCSTPAPSGGTGGDGGSGGTNGRPGATQDDTTTEPDDAGDSGTPDDGAPLTGRLPADWPADVVVPEGEIVQSMSMGSSWLALIDVADTAAAFATSSASLQAAGYAAVSEVVTDHGSIGIYENAELQVQIAVATSPEAGWTMSYTITEKG
jgi:hypothetical protein